MTREMYFKSQKASQKKSPQKDAILVSTEFIAEKTQPTETPEVVFQEKSHIIRAPGVIVK
jgi:hypothetical protein